jgi:hypothetical protein
MRPRTRPSGDAARPDRAGTRPTFSSFHARVTRVVERVTWTALVEVDQRYGLSPAPDHVPRARVAVPHSARCLVERAEETRGRSEFLVSKHAFGGVRRYFSVEERQDRAPVTVDADVTRRTGESPRLEPAKEVADERVVRPRRPADGVGDTNDTLGRPLRER